MASVTEKAGGRLPSRLLAGGVHFIASGAVVGVLALSMWFVWYRPPYFAIDGGWHVLRIILLVDVILGPLLTFIVFDRKKPELKRDLLIIVCVQVCAFAYGVGTLYLHRPVFIASLDKNLYCVNWRDLEKIGEDLAQVRELASSGSPPVAVQIDMPLDGAERAKVWRAVREGGPLLIHQAARFRQMTPASWDDLLGQETPVEAMAKGDAVIAAELARVRSNHRDLPFSRLAFVPLSCRYDLTLAVFDRQSRKLIDWMN